MVDWPNLFARELLSTAITFLAIMLFLNRRAVFTFLALVRYVSATKRSVIAITHVRSAGFGASMLTMEQAVKVERRLRAMNGRPVDLILTTFGGDLLAGLRLAKVLRDHPNVRLVVPKYAFSAGTLMAVGARAVLAHPSAVFGPVDPQFGWFFDGVHSAKDWQHAARMKGAEAKDSTIANAEVGRRLMSEMRAELGDLYGEGVDRERATSLLLEADASHALHIRPGTLASLGFPVEVSSAMSAAEHVVENGADGVYSLKGPR